MYMLPDALAVMTTRLCDYRPNVATALVLLEATGFAPYAYFKLQGGWCRTVFRLPMVKLSMVQKSCTLGYRL